jgi:hypothetical protein
MIGNLVRLVYCSSRYLRVLLMLDEAADPHDGAAHLM